MHPRHHPDIDNRPDWVIPLCDECHKQEDQRLGKRGQGGKPKGPRRIDPLPPIKASEVDPGRPPLLILCGCPGSGKTALAKALGVENRLENAGSLKIERVKAWLEASVAELAAIEHVGVSEEVHRAVLAHVEAIQRSALVVVCYVRPNTRHARVMHRPDRPQDCDRHELSAWGDRVGWVIKQLYPPQRACWLNCEAPPHVGALHVKRELDRLVSA